MTWKPIVAGVDTSPEGAWAAATAWRLATAGGVPCHLIHVVADVAIPPGSTLGVADVAAFRAAVLPVAREQVRKSLEGKCLPREGRAGRAGPDGKVDRKREQQDVDQGASELSHEPEPERVGPPLGERVAPVALETKASFAARETWREGHAARNLRRSSLRHR
jgi:hypothetical protein